MGIFSKKIEAYNENKRALAESSSSGSLNFDILSNAKSLFNRDRKEYEELAEWDRK